MGAFDDLNQKNGAFSDMEPQTNKKVNGFDRVIKGLRDPIDGGVQLLEHVLPDSVVQGHIKLNNWLAERTPLVTKLPEGGVDQAVRQAEAEYQQARKNSMPQSVSSLVTGKTADPGFDGMRLVGNLLNPANYIGGGAAANAATLPAKVGWGALSGGISGLLAPVANGDFLPEKLKQVATSATAAGAMPVVGNLFSRVINPKAASNPDLQLLKSEGITPTIGQTLGGKWNALEEKLQSLPIMGDAIAKARERALNEFNNVAVNRSLKPIGQKVQGTGQNAVKDAGDLIGLAYDDAKNAIGGFQLDQQALQELGNLKQLAGSLPAKEQKIFENMWQTVGNEISPNGSLIADAFKRVDSKLGKEAGRFSGASDAYQQQLGDAFSEMKRILFENAKRSSPQASDMLRNADSAYANLVRVEGASKAAMNNNGVFTPGQLNTAVRQMDNSVRKRAVSRGTALMQDLSNAGQNVLGNKVPNSFTTDRALIAGGTLGGGALLHPAIPLGLAAGAGAYTKPVQGLLNSAVSSRPESAKLIADSFEEAAARLLPLSSQVSLGLLNY